MQNLRIIKISGEASAEWTITLIRDVIISHENNDCARILNKLEKRPLSVHTTKRMHNAVIYSRRRVLRTRKNNRKFKMQRVTADFCANNDFKNEFNRTTATRVHLKRAYYSDEPNSTILGDKCKLQIIK